MYYIKCDKNLTKRCHKILDRYLDSRVFIDLLSLVYWRTLEKNHKLLAQKSDALNISQINIISNIILIIVLDEFRRVKSC